MQSDVASQGFGWKEALGIVNPVGAIGTIGAGLLEGGLDIYGARQQNKWAVEAAEKQMQFQRDERIAAQEWEKKMSNSAYPRVVRGLKKAGLNPMLAIDQGPASTPSSSAGSGAMATPVNPEYGRIVSSALDMVRTFAHVRQAEASATLAETEAGLREKLGEKGEASEKIWKFINHLMDKMGAENAAPKRKFGPPIRFKDPEIEKESQRLWEKY